MRLPLAVGAIALTALVAGSVRADDGIGVGRIENWYCCAKHLGYLDDALGTARRAGGADLSPIRKAAHQ